MSSPRAPAESAPRSGRPGLDRERILAAAAEIGDADGLAAITTTRLAERLHIKPPSLYQHYANVEMIKDALATRALGEMIDLYKDVTLDRTGREALNALAHAERTYAQARPGRFLAAMQAGAGQAALSTLRQTYLRMVATALETYHLDAGTAMEAARPVVAAIQGFLLVELNGLAGSLYEADQSYQRLIDMLDAGARAAARAAANRRRAQAVPEGAPAMAPEPARPGAPGERPRPHA